MKPNFKEWACSLSGCDGGNPEAEIWICGIEPGLENNDYYKKKLPIEINKGKYSPPEKYDWKDKIEGSGKSNYGRNIAKLYSAIKGKKGDNYIEVIKTCSGSEIFKMNLYPIPFRNTDDREWENYGLKELTGFDDKYSFQTWCTLHRFPAIANLLKDKNPKLIIGTGISYLRDFFLFFTDRSDIDKNINYDKIESPEQKPRPYYWAELRNGTLLFVIPFGSGAYGLNSKYLIQEIGNRMRQLISKTI
jgi:hypothetical protein